MNDIGVKAIQVGKMAYLLRSPCSWRRPCFGVVYDHVSESWADEHRTVPLEGCYEVVQFPWPTRATRILEYATLKPPEAPSRGCV